MSLKNISVEDLNKKIISISKLFILLLIINSSTYKAKAQEKKSKLASDIAEEYIKSFPMPKTELEDVKVEKSDKKAFLKARLVQLDAYTKREIVLDKIVGGSKQHEDIEKSMEYIFNEYLWKDLKLYNGTTSEPTYHLMSKINKTTTCLGESVLALMLATPTSNVDLIQKRQEIIKLFIKHKDDRKQIIASFDKFKDSEEGVFSFWSQRDPLYTKEYVSYMKKFYFDSNESNKIASRLLLSKVFFRDYWDIAFRVLYPFHIYAVNVIVNSIISSAEVTKHAIKTFPSFIPFYNYFYFYNEINKNKDMNMSQGDFNKLLLVSMTLTTFVNLIWAWMSYSAYGNYKEYSQVLRNLAKRMVDIQSFIKSAEQISKIISSNPELEKIYGAKIANIRALLKLGHPKATSEIGKLVYYMKTLPLKSWSYFFNNAGKLLASFKLFVEHKDKFYDAFFDYGNLDAFISFARLMDEAEAYNKDNKYVFAKLLSRSVKSKPYVNIKDMWNPFLDSKIAVPNTLIMDASPKKPRNIILTGPNAGGKSTFITGICLAIILAQVVGIAPAKSITITPFNKINTYIEVVDDIAAGKSLFMAEVDRAQKHINVLKKLKKDEFSFTIFDEPFSGTNPTEGAAAEYSILEAIADYDNAINIVATHYPIVMLLEKNAKNKGFVNYKVYIKPSTTKGNKRIINYTYKVIKGRSTQAIAIDILESEGYDIRMLTRARDIISNPHKYDARFSKKSRR